MQTKKFHVCLYILLVLFFISCKQEIKKNTFSDFQNSRIQNQEELQVKWSDSLKVYNPFNLTLVSDNQVLTQSKFKVYVYLNLACSSCLDELNEWSKLSILFKEKKVELRMICYAKDNFEYFKYLYESKEIKQLPFPFFLEEKFDFSKHNKMFKKYEMNQIALTDNEDNILLFGNIIHSKDIYNTFLNIINK
jgi:hypothetical protein